MKLFKTFFKQTKLQTPKMQFTEQQITNHTYVYGQKKAIWTERNYKKLANEAYIKNVVAHRCINMVAHAAASIQLKLYHFNENQQWQPITSHPILNLLNKPNPIQSSKEFLQSLYTYRQIHGNAYILFITPNNTHPKEMYTLRPDRVSVLAGDNFLPAGYRYNLENQHIDYMINQKTGFSQILHIKNFHPLSDWYGLPPTEPATYSIDQHNQAGAWNQALLQNGARPSGAIIVKNTEGKPANLNTEQFNHLKMMIDENFSGYQNAGRPILLEGGLEWKEMSMSPKDMDFIESKHSASRDIALAFGVPPQLLGIPGDNTYSNLIEARIALWEQNIIPYVESTIEHLNRWLTAIWGDNYKINYDIENISALSAKRDAVWSRLNNINFMTINEKRNALGLAPINGIGDRLQ